MNVMSQYTSNESAVKIEDALGKQQPLAGLSDVDSPNTLPFTLPPELLEQLLPH